MNDASLVMRNDSLMSAPVDDDIVFLNPASDSYVALDAMGRRIWELLAQPMSVAALVDTLSAQFEGDRADIHGDVIAFLEELVNEGLVRVEE